ncbi:MAG: recN [Alphaproteobacteria bacterium]|nr:recN [Alphaproteobacteria bacterium]MDB5740661.1 recN [Alphaproteobacteria bacterium]
MLATLTIRDIVLIEQAALEFAPGLNVLTGETGAGKSILLDSLGLAVGGRGRASVRAGAQQGSATAVFEPQKNHAARALLAGQEMAATDEIVLRRTLAADGRSRAFINDEAVGVGLLKDLGGLLLEVHGQQDDRGLFDTATHRLLLDGFGGLNGDAQTVAALYAELAGARAALEELKALAERAQAEADYVRAAAIELSDFDPQPGEEAKLAGERALMQNASRIAEDVSSALESLSGERGAETGLAQALKKLSRMNEEARKIAAPAEVALEQAYALAEEARRELDSLLSRLDTDTNALEKAEERLFALRALARKYGVLPDALPGVRDDFVARQEALVSGGSQIMKAQAKVAAARDAYLTAARKLSKAREGAAKKLEAAVAGELTPLKLGHAKFRVAMDRLDDDQGVAAGLEKIAFEIATVEGAAFGGLAKIASGGELARFSLALKVALAQVSSPAAMVFDEVDRGVGGAVADAVGERLQRLAETTQVLLVTHSPQVAARAARHFRISRAKDKTKIELLTDEERLEEIARMLSGANVTEEARAAARRLMAEALVSKVGAPKKTRKRA